GASLATFLAAAAPAHGVAVDSLALGDPPGLRARRWPDVLRRYVSESRGLSRDVERNPLPSYRLAYRRRAGADRARAFVRQARLNYALVRGHGRGRLAEELTRVLAAGVPTSIAVGERSLLSPVPEIAGFVADLPPRARALCDVVVLAGRHHGWLHDVPMYLRTILVHLEHKSAFVPGAGRWPARLG
ncbi:MAG TPA: hypothetical protein VFT95_05465, partial [Micromonosporaceae bacterium]|nr:hypothetical protein [Micromonosporaceae bacterium]